MSENNKINFIYKFNDKCDTCKKVFKMVAMMEDKKICSECLKMKFKQKYKVDPENLKLDKDTEKALDETVDKIVNEIKKNNEQ